MKIPELIRLNSNGSLDYSVLQYYRGGVAGKVEIVEKISRYAAFAVEADDLTTKALISDIFVYLLFREDTMSNFGLCAMILTVVLIGRLIFVTSQMKALGPELEEFCQDYSALRGCKFFSSLANNPVRTLAIGKAEAFLVETELQDVMDGRKPVEGLIGKKPIIDYAGTVSTKLHKMLFKFRLVDEGEDRYLQLAQCQVTASTK